MNNEIVITGQEANILLYAFDAFFEVDERGTVGTFVAGPATRFPVKQLQDLRDRLFAVHEHPEN